MKKFTFLFFMALSMFLCAHADNYLTIGQNENSVKGIDKFDMKL